MRCTTAASFALGLATGLTFVNLPAVAGDSIESVYQKLEVLAQVLSQVESNYVDAVSPQALVWGAARGAVATLDEHSAFFTPDEYKALMDVTEGEYAGIGIEVGWRDEGPEVQAVLDDSAAMHAGLKVGDIIAAVDGEETWDMGLDILEDRLKGPVGSKVVVVIKRASRQQPLTFTLVRSWVRVAPLVPHQLPDGIDYVQVKTFSRRVASDLEAVLRRQPPRRGLVLDLRGNPGGLFDEAVAMCDLFLADGAIVSAVGRGGRIIERHQAHASGTQPAYPLAILIDRSSASAAEVVAGALSDRGRARLFGERSYGKGSVQSIIDLSDGSGLKLTVARYYTPSGRQIDGHGVEPDEKVATDAGSQSARDVVLEAAVHWLQRQPGPT